MLAVLGSTHVHFGVDELFGCSGAQLQFAVEIGGRYQIFTMQIYYTL